MPALVAASTRTRLDRLIRLTAGAAMILVAGGVLLASLWAPLLPDCNVSPGGNCQTSPIGQKIFYFHVPFAFASYLALVVLVFASYRVLARDDAVWDELAAASGEVGVLFAGLTLLTGMLWGHLEWGVYWRNEDLKLVITGILFLVYAAYLVLRRQIDDPRRRARVAAVYGIIGFVLVPLSYAAGRVWQELHPCVFGACPTESGIVTPRVEETFVVNAIALAVLAVALILLRFRVGLRLAEEAAA